MVFKKRRGDLLSPSALIHLVQPPQRHAVGARTAGRWTSIKTGAFGHGLPSDLQVRTATLHHIIHLVLVMKGAELRRPRSNVSSPLPKHPQFRRIYSAKKPTGPVQCLCNRADLPIVQTDARPGLRGSSANIDHPMNRADFPIAISSPEVSYLLILTVLS